MSPLTLPDFARCLELTECPGYAPPRFSFILLAALRDAVHVCLLARAAHDQQIAVAQIQLERHRVRGVRFEGRRYFFARLEREAPRRAPRNACDGRARHERALVVAVISEPVVRLVPVLEAAVQVGPEGMLTCGEQFAAGRLRRDRRRLGDLPCICVGHIAEGARVAVLVAAPVKHHDFAALGWIDSEEIPRGNPYRLINAIDWNGQLCGFGADVKGKNYAYYMASGEAVCVKKCPSKTDYNAFVCKNDPDVTARMATAQQADAAVSETSTTFYQIAGFLEVADTNCMFKMQSTGYMG